MTTTLPPTFASALLVLGLAASGLGTAPSAREADDPVRPTISLATKDAPRADVPGTVEVKAAWFGMMGIVAPSNRRDVINRAVSTRIVSILPEGSIVKEGDQVSELDPGIIEDQFREQQITAASAESTLVAAELAWQAALVAIQEYTEGTFLHDRAALLAAIEAGQAARKRAETLAARVRKTLEELDRSRPQSPATRADLMIPIELTERLMAAEGDVDREKRTIDLSTAKLRTLESFTRDRVVTDLKHEQARRRSELTIAESRFALQRDKLRKLERRVDAYRLVAPIGGQVVYGQASSTSPTSMPRIEEGATVQEGQRVFSIVPVGAPLHLIVHIDGDLVGSVRPGQSVRIKAGRPATETLEGIVKAVAITPERYGDIASGRPVFRTVVEISRPSPSLRLGMTAQAEFDKPEPNLPVQVPATSVELRDGRTRVHILKPDGAIEWRDVVIEGAPGEAIRQLQQDGANVRISKGVTVGERIVTDPPINSK